jgi:nitrous oxide reductase accessory protein NosL
MSRSIVGRAALVLLVLASAFSAGCGPSKSAAPPQPGRKITREEYRKMSAEEKDDPYTKAHLEPLPPKKTKGKR